ncbi:hypothetical protein ASA1KI_12030 [Opitutales bacterium ASA1]|uniref:type II toxin-antitoxin system Phd/YefM family antitoxin n=1 Tax=Congregicoccus parvus TaxID=3081749 RepID=UPI002B31168B|nr:hypothetical protein ASA1KI_12030 [Opitutales bacterium ASA1]
MHMANIATTKNELSRLLRRVKRGESVVITERNHPIARIVPYAPDGDSGAVPPTLAALFEAGVLVPPNQPDFDLDAFFRLPQPSVSATGSLVSAVMAERDESR